MLHAPRSPQPIEFEVCLQAAHIRSQAPICIHAMSPWTAVAHARMAVLTSGGSTKASSKLTIMMLHCTSSIACAEQGARMRDTKASVSANKVKRKQVQVVCNATCERCTWECWRPPSDVVRPCCAHRNCAEAGEAFICTRWCVHSYAYKGTWIGRAGGGRSSGRAGRSSGRVRRSSRRTI